INDSLISWEEGENHRLHITNRMSSICLPSLYLRSDEPLWRGAGVAIPVFSLRTIDDYGCGDFKSLIQIIDWAAETGQNFVQLLPVNDTNMTGTKADSYPYNAISSFALHPMYINPDSIGSVHDKEQNARFNSEKNRLNALPTVDYEAVMRLKTDITHILFEQQGFADLNSDSFHSFFNENAAWLEPYAAYCILRDIHHTANFTQWGEYAVHDADSIAKFLARHRKERDYVYFIQYHLDRQLRAASTHAHRRGVNLKGDLPIGIARNSVEAWLAPELYNLESSAGAPPDDFSVTGQNWGFPTYNWERMAKDDYRWWKARFRKMADYFDAYRIDHLLGFFRIWQIPATSVRGLTGTFYPALPLSYDEISNKYGFDFNAEIHTVPYLTSDILHSALKDYPEAISQYFEKKDDENDFWQFKPEYSSQKLIDNHLQNSEPTLRDILFALSENLLFIPDPNHTTLYHPRIAARGTSAYAALPPSQRQAFDRIHDDFFYHRHNDFWRESAMSKLPPLIDATSMLACAEDLGMIPDCVPGVMNDLRLLSLEVQRMPKQYGKTFDNPADYPRLSVSTTSTHDMAPLRLWWRQSPQLTTRYYNEILHRSGEAPHDADADICYTILADIMRSPSMLAIIPLQDWLAISDNLKNPNPEEEQINNPANPHHYWRYRMHIDIAQMRSDKSFNDRVRSLVAMRKS
ncbi:MAG: 4-alpha-glucanotransferase, partial [Paramuribaculum sp.]|nr:4-alpha-glucanotransferase [Paramuribaculum sp.]